MQSDQFALLRNLEQLLQGKLHPVQKDYYDISDAAHYLGLSKEYMYKLNFRKEIRFRKSGKKVRYAKEDLDSYINRHIVPSKYDIEEKAQKHIENLNKKER